MRMMSLGALVSVLAIWTVQMAAAATVTSSSIGHYIRFLGWRHQTKAEDGRQSLQESHVFKPAIPKVQSAPVPQTIEGSRSEENNLPPNLGFGLGSGITPQI